MIAALRRLSFGICKSKFMNFFLSDLYIYIYIYIAYPHVVAGLYARQKETIWKNLRVRKKNCWTKGVDFNRYIFYFLSLFVNCTFYQMRSEGFSFNSGGLGV